MTTSTIETLLPSLYESICFRKGENPTFERLREHFLPEALLINNNNPSAPTVMTLEGFIRTVQNAISSGQVVEFHEREIERTIKIVGNIAHVFSKYEARFDAVAPEPFSVGTNSIQLIRTEGKNGSEWHISSMAWNDLHEKKHDQ
ncbi:MAG: hypothetical protein MUF71_18890 [Candidatus Kapabacteria bacterium]|jgi:hypothetical protein|nr:hypothetical protein [Candidatus Kapabacteria bacterium]